MQVPDLEELKENDVLSVGSYNNRNISISRPSMISDVLTEDDNYEGILEKQSPSFLKRWQKRYFVLCKKMLKYYKTEADFRIGKPPKGVLNFQQIWIEPKFQEKERKMDLHIFGC